MKSLNTRFDYNSIKNGIRSKFSASGRNYADLITQDNDGYALHDAVKFIKDLRKEDPVVQWWNLNYAEKSSSMQKESGFY